MTEVVPSGGMSTTRERVKCLEVGCHVSGSFGEYWPNPVLISREGFVNIYGLIFSAVDWKKYKVHWDDGQDSERFSNWPLKALLSATLPLDLPPSHQQENPELPPQGQAQADEEEEEISASYNILGF